MRSVFVLTPICGIRKKGDPNMAQEVQKHETGRTGDATVEKTLRQAAQVVANKYAAQVRLLQKSDARFVGSVSGKAADFVFTQ